MAVPYNTRISYTSNGVLTDYAIPFSYVDQADVTVIKTSDGSAIPFTFVNPSLIRLTSVPANGVAFKIIRKTDLTNPKVVWKSGGGVRGDSLNAMITQIMNAVQENTDRIADGA